MRAAGGCVLLLTCTQLRRRLKAVSLSPALFAPALRLKTMPRVFVRGLSDRVTWAELERVFSRHGRVLEGQKGKDGYAYLVGCAE